MPGDGTVFEHVGSYSELLVKLNKNKSPEKESKKQNSKVVPQVAENKRTSKLSYNQQRLLNVLPQEISELEQQLEVVKLNLSDSNLYIEKPEEFNRLTLKYKEITELIDQKENQWLEIQMIKEDLENNI